MTSGPDAMGVFLATLAVFGVACLLLGAGLILDNRKLQGGCGHKPPGAPRCDTCPNAHRHGRKGDSTS